LPVSTTSPGATGEALGGGLAVHHDLTPQFDDALRQRFGICGQRPLNPRRQTAGCSGGQAANELTSFEF
jgi:hypothetical protein